VGVSVIPVSVGREEVEWMVRFDRLVLRNFMIEWSELEWVIRFYTTILMDE
jgi:hypothetical protein